LIDENYKKLPPLAKVVDTARQRVISWWQPSIRGMTRIGPHSETLGPAQPITPLPGNCTSFGVLTGSFDALALVCAS
jgi:hypothetical protein